MRKGTKIALAASALVIAGAAGLSSLAVADYRGSHGGKHHKASFGKGHHGAGYHRGWGGKKRHHARRMERMMERFDTNEDGKLTQAELDDARKALIAKHDSDKDGKLSLDEFEKLWLEFMHRRMVRGFQRIDTDGDASITVEEFLKPYSKIVERFDRNEDGALDKQDRRHKRHHKHHDDGDEKDQKKEG